MGKAVLAVQAAAKEGREDEFDEWYTNVHLRDLLAVPGVTGATRYRVSGVQLGEPQLPPARHLTLYAIESDDLAATLQAVVEALPGMAISDAVDPTLASAVVYEQIAHRDRGDA
jgi:hypothetical protein